MFNLWWILFNSAKIYDPDRKYGDCNILDGNLCFINVHNEHKWVLMTSQTEKYNDQDFLKNINTWSMWCDALLHPEFLTPSLCVSSLSKKAPHQHFSLHKMFISPQNLCERQNFNPQILFLKSTIISIWQQSTGIFYVKVHLPTPQIDKVHQKELVPMPSSDGGVWELVDSLNTAPLLHSNTKYVIATRNVVYFASYENDAIWNTCQINQKIVFFVIRFLD